jgi:hypothetical protein
VLVKVLTFGVDGTERSFPVDRSISPDRARSAADGLRERRAARGVPGHDTPR